MISRWTCVSVRPLVVRPSVCISFSETPMDFHQTWFAHWYCGDLVWDYLWANFVKFWRSYLPETRPCIFSFPDDNMSKCQGILTKLDTFIDIKEIWFGIADGQISSTFELSARDTIMTEYYRFMFLLYSQLTHSAFNQVCLIFVRWISNTVT